jgi:hypothetical protein
MGMFTGHPLQKESPAEARPAGGSARIGPPRAALMNVDGFGDRIPVAAFGPRIVCTSCGIVGADVRPNWKERSERASLTGLQWR